MVAAAQLGCGVARTSSWCTRLSLVLLAVASHGASATGALQPQGPSAFPTDREPACATRPGACVGEADDIEVSEEALLLKVSMLQTSLSVGARKKVVLPALGSEPASQAHLDGVSSEHRTTAIQAEGELEEAPLVASLHPKVVRPGKSGLVASVLQGDLPGPPVPVDTLPRKAAAGPRPAQAAHTEPESSHIFSVRPPPAERLPDLRLAAMATTVQHNATGRVAPAGLFGPGRSCLPGFCDLSLKLQLDTLTEMGGFPHSSHIPQLNRHQGFGTGTARANRAHADGHGLQLWQADISLHNALQEHKPGEWAVMLSYFLFYVLSMAALQYYMIHGKDQKQRQVEYDGHGRRRVTDVDVEEDMYQRSFLGWLAVSWASPWVARWGHSFNAALTKIRADELPQMGTKDLQARNCAKTFQELWQEEIDEVGLAKANLWRVIVKIWTVRSMLTLMFILAVQITLGSIYSVLLIEMTLDYYYWLQNYIDEHPDESPSMVTPMLLGMLVFSVLPFSNVLLSSINNSMSVRLDQKLCGGLAVALFQKAQRLPSAQLQGKKNDEDEDDQTQQADLMSLINYDVMANLCGCYQQLCMTLNALVGMVVLTVLLWQKLGLATLCALACALPVFTLTLILAACLGQCMHKLQGCMDKRIVMLREVLFGIRVVKSYAWEEAMEQNISDLRKDEMVHLTTYYHFLGTFTGVFLSFPRLLILSGLWGYSAIYGHHDVATIFTCMQILSSLKSVSDVFMRTIGRSIMLFPSIQRIEHFLKLTEAPLVPPFKTPDWVELWPVDEPAPAAEGAQVPQHLLSIHGSYRWHENGPAVLFNLNLDVPKGELVGIIGEVGSGKSTLLQALLGELYPSRQESRISRPSVIAYCSQVPHIAEGTLKENVLFGQVLEAERYAEAIRCASLEGDLNVLPGGDSVPIGTRGITLSGGQKARVAMARAAYHQASELVILDDPFGAVDAPTAMVLLDKLLLGPLMNKRTRIVVLQPETERLQKFDRVIVMSGGRIIEQGTPEEVFATEAYKRLLRSTTDAFAAECEGASSPKKQVGETASGKPKHNQALQAQLREDEFEGRPTWEMVKAYCRLGRWRNILNTSLLFFIQIFVYLLCDLVLAHWTNAMAVDPNVDDRPYLFGYLFWLCVGTAIWVICWKFGEWFTLRISRSIHDMVVHKILRAPVDRFFDKHPVGRIMNRLSADLAAVDLFLFNKSTGTIAILYQTLIPLLYVHTIMPWFVTLLAIPFYYLIWTSCVRYWNTTVPLKYCAASSRSEVNSLISDVVSSNVVIRAYQDQERITLEMCGAIDDMLKANLLGDRVLRRWLVNRLLFMWSFYTTTTFIVGITNPLCIGAGTLGLCLTNLLLLESLIEPNLDGATGAQFEFIALARIHEYLAVPQEKPRRSPSDSRYRSFSVRIPRKDLGELTYVDAGDVVEVLRNGRPLLQSTLECSALMPSTAFSDGCVAKLQDLCPTLESLGQADAWHRIVAVNDVVRDARSMAKELCYGKTAVTAASLSAPKEVILEIQSGWLLGGARVDIEAVKVGYADIPRDVLKGINLVFQPKHKVAVVGTTGCGKSSLLLLLLRVLEPRAGRVLLNGVDTRDVGLATLRTAMGLVPQDPVLFSGTLRHNLDPFGQYSDGRLWHAVRCVHLGSLVESWSLKLDHHIENEGSNLSFGQRQLVCLARMVLRQPPLLLLDEATSAIDPHTQEQVQKTINSAFPGSTLIAVAHRLETVLDFDQVVVLQNGVVAEQGPVKEVSQMKDGLFRQMLAAKRMW